MERACEVESDGAAQAQSRTRTGGMMGLWAFCADILRRRCLATHGETQHGCARCGLRVRRFLEIGRRGRSGYCGWFLEGTATWDLEKVESASRVRDIERKNVWGALLTFLDHTVRYFVFLCVIAFSNINSTLSVRLVRWFCFSNVDLETDLLRF